jgi:glycosyltransferase involved in cell wall biosynthesis
MSDKKKILFLNHWFPSQQVHLLKFLQETPDAYEIVAISEEKMPKWPGIKHLTYAPNRTDLTGETGVGYVHMAYFSQQILEIILNLHAEGFVPDLICAHIDTGPLYLKTVWPQSPVLAYAEYYRGSTIAFDREFSANYLMQHLVYTGINAAYSSFLLQADAIMTPSPWQKHLIPRDFHHKTYCIFDGIDTANIEKLSGVASMTLPSGQVMKRGEESILHINRHLEPFRGLHIFLRALPKILKERPKAEVYIVGGLDQNHVPSHEFGYGDIRPPEGKTWREVFWDEVKDQLDTSRVHFVGKVPEETLIKMLGVCAVNAYLTYPAFLSWSVLMAQAAGALTIASDTAPVRDVIQHDRNGLLVPFFDVEGWSNQVIEVLKAPKKFSHLKSNGKVLAKKVYDLESVCLPAQKELFFATMERRPPQLG